MEFPDILVILERQVLQDIQVLNHLHHLLYNLLLDHQAHQDIQDQQGQLAYQANQDTQVLLAHLDPLVQLEVKVFRDMLDPPERMENPDIQVILEIQVSPD